MKRFIFFIILLFGSITGSFAQQEKRILITGTVKNTFNEPVPFTHVIVNRKKAMACDNNGKFLFWGHLSDTLIFTAIGYKNGKFIIPAGISADEYSFNKILLADTVRLKEAVVLQWHTYREFIDDVVKTKIPEDNYSRAEKNIKTIFRQYELMLNDPDAPSFPGACQNYVQQRRNYQTYYAGQAQPMNIFNVAAWSQLIKAIERGDFKKKKKEDEDK